MLVHEQVAENASVWRQKIEISDAIQRRLRENLRDLSDVSAEASLTDPNEEVSKICKSTLFEMSQRGCIGCSKDASMTSGK